MSRSVHAVAPKASGPSIKPHLEDYAFNIFGWAIKLKEVPLLTHLNAYEPSSTDWKTAVKVMEGEGTNPWRKSNDLTPRETGEAEIGMKRYLLVGYAVWNVNEKDFAYSKLCTEDPAYKKRTFVPGLAIPEEFQCVTGERELPLLVVIQVDDEKPEGARLYVLLKPARGLCTPYHIGQKEVFYLAMFRDHTTALRNRGPNWNRLALAHAIKPPSEGEPSQKQEKNRKARDTSKVVLDPTQSIRNKILCLVAGFAQTKDVWHLKELERVLEQADTDLEHQPPIENEMLHAFLDNDREMIADDLEALRLEIQTMWPDLTDVSIEGLESLKLGLRGTGQVLEYHLLRPFIAEGCWILENAQHQGVSLDTGANWENKLVSQVVGTIRRVIGYASTASIRLDQERLLLTTGVIKSLREIVKRGNDFDQGLKDMCGDQTNDGTLHDI